MLGVDAGESLRHGGVVGHVEGQRVRVQPVAPERVGGRLGGCGIAAVDEHARATAGQRPRDAQTQPTGRSGHQRDLAAEFEVAQIRQGIHVIRLWLGTGTGKKRRACWIAGSPRPGPRGSGFAGPQRRPWGGAQRWGGPAHSRNSGAQCSSRRSSHVTQYTSAIPTSDSSVTAANMSVALSVASAVIIR